MEANYFYEKRQPHYKCLDWYSEMNKIQRSVADRFDDSVVQCREGSELRKSVSNGCVHNREITECEMLERIQDVELWSKKLWCCCEKLEKQMRVVSEVKQSLAKKIEEYSLLLEATRDILSIRDRRRGIDLVEDDVHERLKEELDLLSSVLKRLRCECDENAQMIVELKEQWDRLMSDIRDKDVGLQIDNHIRELTPFSKDMIGLKPWAEEIPELTVTIQSWLGNCVELKTNAEEVFEKSLEKVVISKNVIRDSDNDIRKCREITRTSMRFRLEETLRARDSLVTQRKQLVETLSRLKDEIDAFDITLSDNRNNLMLVHTRLEDRKFRPRKELCDDPPQQRLLQVHANVKGYHNKCAKTSDDLKSAYNSTVKLLQEVEEDLQRKEHSFAIETTCLEIHEKPPKTQCKTDIAWMHLTPESSYVKGCIDRHLYVRENNVRKSAILNNGLATSNVVNGRLMKF